MATAAATTTEPARSRAASPPAAVLAGVLGIAAAAWLLVWAQTRGATGRFAHLHGPGASPSPWLLAAGWLTMVAAMMLPLALSFLATIARLVQARPRPWLLVTASAFGFFIPWVVTGQLFEIFDAGIHFVVDRTPWLSAHDALLVAGALVLAGVYQFTPIKTRSLMVCRSPFGLVARRWRGAAPMSESMLLGTAYGTSCVGCCWTLMLVMFAVGAANLALMVGMALAMAAERVPGIRRTAAPVLGVALLCGGAAIAIGAL